jgi:hypothetical protein
MEPIKNTIKEVLNSWKAQKKAASADDTRLLLKQVFSAKERKHVCFGSFKKGILSIKVDSSPWLYQLTLQKRDLLSRARAVSCEVKDIRFSIGDMTNKDS